MKINPLFLENYINTLRVKFFDYFALISKEKFQRNKSVGSNMHLPFIKNISKTEKYQKIIEKIKSLKINDELKDKQNKSKNTASFLNEIISSSSYQNLISQINQFKKKKVKQKKSKKNIKKVSLKKKEADSDNFQNIISQINQFKFLSFLKLQKRDFIKNLIPKSKIKNQLFEELKKFRFFNKDSLVKPKNKKFDQKIGMIFYSDHNLIFISLNINLNNRIKINGLTEIPIPGNVIGDSLVEDSNELANIALDSINLLDLNTAPILVVISSSFFNIHTFKASDLKQISLSDRKVQSKSPYLPDNTLVDFLRMSDPQISNGFVRTTYSQKDFIKGWTDTLEMIDLPIIGLVPTAPLIFDAITKTIVEEKTILIDIESTVTTLLIGGASGELNSHKLPFGSSLYVSSNLKDSGKNYFDRVSNSIKIIMNNNNEKPPLNIFVMGSGLDNLINSEFHLPKGFKSINELKLSEFSYSPKTMQIHELLSDSIDSRIFSLASILTLCV
ncbi:MAG: hypothetical protein JJ844_00205 [Prochlorococcus marinus CUG1435]|nr:hypothetical protein [Prochlorococcus marinus CUG1435]